MDGLSKTPDEIKMNEENAFLLREAAKSACAGYYDHLSAGGKGDPAEERWIEALTAGANSLAYIRQLESTYSQVSKALCGKENATAEEIIAAFDQVKRERDALLKALKRVDLECEYCKHCNIMEDVCKLDCSSCELDADKCPCNECRNNSHWEWAGIKEDNQ